MGPGRYATEQGRRHGATIGGGGGRGLFEVDSFHATPIGLMLNTEKFAGTGPPVPPMPPPMRLRRLSEVWLDVSRQLWVYVGLQMCVE